MWLSGLSAGLRSRGCRFDPWSGHIKEATNEYINKCNNKSMSLSLSKSILKKEKSYRQKNIKIGDSLPQIFQLPSPGAHFSIFSNSSYLIQHWTLLLMLQVRVSAPGTSFKHYEIHLVLFWEQDSSSTGGQYKAPGLNPALHLVLSGPTPCFYLVAAPRSCLTVKEQLHLYSPKITFGPLKATTRLWPPVKMSLTSLK